MQRRFLRILALFLVLSAVSQTQEIARSRSKTAVMIRCDDLGMCHTVNMAAQKVLESGLPVSVSVMFTCPWYQEAVELLERYPRASVGIHLTLNSEWKHYRWGPVAGRSRVPSLVDSQGYFFPSRAALFGNHPKLEEIEIELRSQIERGLDSGLRIDYVDYHMGAAVNTLETREIVESLAREYNLGISRYFGEVDAPGVYSAPVASKTDTLKNRLENLRGGVINLFVFHIGLQTPEMNALVDLNTFGLPEMSKHREAELNALLSPSIRPLILNDSLTIVTYRDLVKDVGLKGMKRPPLSE